VGTEKSFSLIQYSAQRVSIAPGSYDFGSSWGIGDLGKKKYVGTAALGCPPGASRQLHQRNGELLILQAREKKGQTRRPEDTALSAPCKILHLDRSLSSEP
jgi:hypothetical protein